MYSDDDLNAAVKKGIFTEVSVQQFRQTIAKKSTAQDVDEEHFRLVGGFNDIFVVLACALLLFSSVFFVTPISASLGFIVFSLIAWGLSEFFVLKRKMSLPAIMLLFAFVGGIFYLASSFFDSLSQTGLMVAAGASTIATYCHWLRFKVPVTVAAGMVALIGLAVVSFVRFFPQHIQWLQWLWAMLSLCGMLTFMLAMYWDAMDTKRVTGKSDVAFWLHLVSAPLIIHPVFSSLGVFEGNQSLLNMAIVIVLYLLMTLISLIIDRRAFMVSSLIYVVYALSAVIKTYGNVGYSFALTGIFMGAMLLLLSAFWHVTRGRIIALLPMTIRHYIPAITP